MMLFATEIDKNTVNILLNNMHKSLNELNIDPSIKRSIRTGSGKFKNNVVILLWRINQFIKNSQYKQATAIIMLNDKILMDNKYEIQCKLNKLYRKIIRRLFHNQNFTLLKELINININNDEKTNLIIAIIHMLFNNREKSEEILLKIYNESTNNYNKQQACYYLANLQNNHKDRNYWLNLCANSYGCLWSMLAHIELHKPLEMKSIYKVNVLNHMGNKSDEFLNKIVENVKNQQYRKAIDYVYSVHKSHWKECTSTFINTVKYLATHNKDKSALYMLGNLMFKTTGILIEECYPIIKELLYLHKKNRITKKEIAISSAIISMETKFMKHSYFNLDNGKALGVMQIAYREAEIMCKKIGIPYSKNTLLKNDLINIIVGLECVRYNNQLANNNLIFMIYYYHSGHVSHNVYKTFSFVNFNNIACLLGFIGLFEGNCARDYVIGVIEHFIINYHLIFKRLPTINELINTTK
jgi:hypothetical protein